MATNRKNIFIKKDIWYKIDSQNIKEIRRGSKCCHIVFVVGHKPEIPGRHRHDELSYCIKIHNPDEFKEETRSDFIGILFHDALSEGFRTPGSPKGWSSPSHFDQSVIDDSLPVKD